MRGGIWRAMGWIRRARNFILELDMLYGGQFHVKRALSPRLAHHERGRCYRDLRCFRERIQRSLQSVCGESRGRSFCGQFCVEGGGADEESRVAEDAAGGKRSTRRRSRESGRRIGRTEKISLPTHDLSLLRILRPGNVIEGPSSGGRRIHHAGGASRIEIHH